MKKILIVIILSTSILYASELKIQEGNIIFKNNSIYLNLKESILNYNNDYLKYGPLNKTILLSYYPYDRNSNFSAKSMRGLSIKLKNLTLFSLNNRSSYGLLFSLEDINLIVSYHKETSTNSNIFAPLHIQGGFEAIKLYFSYEHKYFSVISLVYLNKEMLINQYCNLSLSYNAFTLSYAYGENLELSFNEKSPVQQYSIQLDSKYLFYCATFRQYSKPIVSGAFREYEGLEIIRFKFNKLTIYSKFNTLFNKKGEREVQKEFSFKYDIIKIDYSSSLSLSLDFNNVEISFNKDSFLYKLTFIKDNYELNISFDNKMKIDFSVNIKLE